MFLICPPCFPVSPDNVAVLWRVVISEADDMAPIRLTVLEYETQNISFEVLNVISAAFHQSTFFLIKIEMRWREFFVIASEW
jgi:hypothetical protein